MDKSHTYSAIIFIAKRVQEDLPLGQILVAKSQDGLGHS